MFEHVSPTSPRARVDILSGASVGPVGAAFAARRRSIRGYARESLLETRTNDAGWRRTPSHLEQPIGGHPAPSKDRTGRGFGTRMRESKGSSAFCSAQVWSEYESHGALARPPHQRSLRDRREWRSRRRRVGRASRDRVVHQSSRARRLNPCCGLANRCSPKMFPCLLVQGIRVSSDDFSGARAGSQMHIPAISSIFPVFPLLYREPRARDGFATDWPLRQRFRLLTLAQAIPTGRHYRAERVPIGCT